MSAPETNSPGGSLRDDDSDPPSLSIEVKKLSDLPKTSKQWSNVDLPVDILLLTVQDSEFLACHYYLRDAFRSYSQTLGYVYFGNMGDQDKSWKVALVKCSKGSSDPGGSQTAVTNAVTLLRPKVTFCVGFCRGLNHENTNLGDVVISCKLTTDAYKTPVSRDVGNLVRYAADGWRPPLECPEAFREVKVHCDGEILSCPGPVGAEQQHKLHPEAIAVEMEGKGMFTAAHDLKSEWVVVKGVSRFADSSANKLWETFASVMAASLVSNILSDPFVFEQWPHYGDTSSGEGSSQSCSKRGLSYSSDHPSAKRSRIADISAGEESSNSHSKRASPCSSDHPDAKQTRLADTSGEDSSQSDHPDAERSRIAAQTTEQDVRDMNREQELDQYEDHDAWLKMVEQDWDSFQRLKEAQTDQQRKRLNMFVARFQDQFPDIQYQCDGCGVILSDIRYRCLNCSDVDFCYDCYTKRVKAEGHTENHEVIEMSNG